MVPLRAPRILEGRESGRIAPSVHAAAHKVEPVLEEPCVEDLRARGRLTGGSAAAGRVQARAAGSVAGRGRHAAWVCRRGMSRRGLAATFGGQILTMVTSSGCCAGCFRIRVLRWLQGRPVRGAGGARRGVAGRKGQGWLGRPPPHCGASLGRRAAFTPTILGPAGQKRSFACSGGRCARWGPVPGAGRRPHRRTDRCVSFKMSPHPSPILFRTGRSSSRRLASAARLTSSMGWARTGGRAAGQEGG